MTVTLFVCGVHCACVSLSHRLQNSQAMSYFQPLSQTQGSGHYYMQPPMQHQPVMQQLQYMHQPQPPFQHNAYPRYPVMYDQQQYPQAGPGQLQPPRPDAAQGQALIGFQQGGSELPDNATALASSPVANHRGFSTGFSPMTPTTPVSPCNPYMYYQPFQSPKMN